MIKNLQTLFPIAMVLLVTFVVINVIKEFEQLSDLNKIIAVVAIFAILYVIAAEKGLLNHSSAAPLEGVDNQAMQEADFHGEINKISLCEGELKNISEANFSEKDVILDLERSKLSFAGIVLKWIMGTSYYENLNPAMKQQFINLANSWLVRKVSEYHDVAKGTFKYGINTTDVKIEISSTDDMSVCKIEIPETAYTVSTVPQYNTVIYGRFLQENALNTEASILENLKSELWLYVTGVQLENNGHIDRIKDQENVTSNKLLDVYEQYCSIWLAKEDQKKFLKSIASNENYSDFDSILINGVEIVGKDNFSDEELEKVFGSLVSLDDLDAEDGETITFYYRDTDKKETMVTVQNGSIVANNGEDPFATLESIKKEREENNWTDQTLVTEDTEDAADASEPATP